MAILEVSPTLAERLYEIARRENRSVEALLEMWIDEHVPEDEPAVGQLEEYPPGSLALLAAKASAAKYQSGSDDVAARSREILGQEWADHLARRITGENER
ncbi:MAG: hypothetical protein JW910_22480 [Anaerolineae bacterium]|nr:hypothetical protein [Anaerolineae bacterium]